MAPIVCQVLSKTQEPLVGMRVTLECLESPILFQAFTPYSGIIDQWMQLSGSPQHGSVVVDAHDFSLCRFTFATAEYFGSDQTPWHAVQVELNLRDQHVLALCCDSLSYGVATTEVAPFPRSPSDSAADLAWSKNFVANTLRADICTGIPNSGRSPRFKRDLRRLEDQSTNQSQEISHLPSPMEDVQFMIEDVCKNEKRLGQSGKRRRNSRRNRDRSRRRSGDQGSQTLSGGVHKRGRRARGRRRRTGE